MECYVRVLNTAQLAKECLFAKLLQVGVIENPKVWDLLQEIDEKTRNRTAEYLR